MLLFITNIEIITLIITIKLIQTSNKNIQTNHLPIDHLHPSTNVVIKINPALTTITKEATTDHNPIKMLTPTSNNYADNDRKR